MVNLMKWDKYDNNFLSVPDLFRDFFTNKNTLFPFITETLPPINVKEEADKYQIMIALPGIDKENCKLTVSDGVLKVFSEKEKEQESKDDNSYSRYEYNYSSFSRSFSLPKNVDSKAISSKYKNGELIISLPKVEINDSGTQEIPIK